MPESTSTIATVEIVARTICSSQNPSLLEGFLLRYQLADSLLIDRSANRSHGMGASRGNTTQDDDETLCSLFWLRPDCGWRLNDLEVIIGHKLVRRDLKHTLLPLSQA